MAATNAPGSQPPVPPSEEDPPSSVEAIYRTTTWLIAAFGAIAAATVAGLQMGGLSEARSTPVAVGAYGVSLVAAITTVVLAGHALLPGYDSPELVETHIIGRTKGLNDQERTARARELIESDPVFAALHAVGIDWKDIKAGGGGAAALGAVNARIARRRYRIVLGSAVVSGALIAVAVPTFALAAAPASDPSPPSVATPREVLVSFDARGGLAALLGPDCALDRVRGVAFGGSEGRPLVAVPPEKGCEGGVFRFDPALGTVEYRSP